MTEATRRRSGVLTLLAGTALVLACDGTDACEPAGPCPAPEPAALPQSVVYQNNRFGATEVFTMNADGSDVRRLTNNPAIDGGARWTPDGTRIVYSSLRGTAREIWIMNADGSDQRQLTSLGLAANQPDMSPVDSRIAFHAPRGDGNFDIWMMNADGSDLHRITAENSALRPRWSPDGSKLLVQWSESTAACSCAGSLPICPCNNRLALMNPDGTGLQLLPAYGLDDSFPEWSPDGRHIAFATLAAPAPGQLQRTHIAVMRADGTGGRALTQATGVMEEWSPAWSPTTGRIFFVRGFVIYSMRADGSDVRRVSATAFADVLVHTR